MAATLGVDNPFRYRGYFYDEETGNYYLNQRYYNPAWGRFINADNYGGSTGGLLSHNLFAYCLNNPVMKSDPSGNRPDDYLYHSPRSTAINLVRKFMKLVNMKINETLGKLPAGQSAAVRSMVKGNKNVAISGDDLSVNLPGGKKLNVLSPKSTTKYLNDMKAEAELHKSISYITGTAAIVAGVFSGGAAAAAGGYLALQSTLKSEIISQNISDIKEINNVSISPENNNYAVFINNPKSGYSGTYEFIMY